MKEPIKILCEEFEIYALHIGKDVQQLVSPGVIYVLANKLNEVITRLNEHEKALEAIIPKRDITD